MPHEIITKIEQKLHEEKWTRTAIGAYTVTMIKELDDLLVQLSEEDLQDEAKQLCDQHLEESKNSIIALYLSGMISLKKQLLDDTNLTKVINLFAQNIKWQIVEHICLQMLAEGENKFALKSLIECYKNEGQDAKLLETEERLVRVDIEEADIVFSLAQRFEKEKNLEKATDYYKKGIHRYIHKKNFPRVREIWLKLLEDPAQDIEYFRLVATKVEKNLGSDKSVQLLEDLYPILVKAKNWDEAIALQLVINDFEPKSTFVRKEVVECVRKKYEANPKTEEYIRTSNLNDSWKPLREALEDFKKQIAYEKGNFVFHKAWGVGRIREVRDQEFVIDFETRQNQVIGQKMAVENLISLAKNDIRVLIATTKDPQKLAERIKKKAEIDWALKTILGSFGNKADMKTIKSILVPKLLKESEWTTWGTMARNHFRESTDFAISPDRPDEFLLRTTPIAIDEKLYNKFKVEKDFFKRIDIFMDFLEKAGDSSDYSGEIFSSFTNILKSNKVNQEVIASSLLVQMYSKDFPSFNPGNIKSFPEYFAQIEDREALFTALHHQKIQTEFLKQIEKNLPNWPEIFCELYPASKSAWIIESLMKKKHSDLVAKLFNELIERHKLYREPMFEAGKIILSELYPVLSQQFNFEKVYITLIHDLDLTARDIANKKDLAANKKLNKQLLTFLFGEADGHLTQFLNQADEQSLRRIFSLIQDVRDLPAKQKQEVKDLIIKRFPHFTFADAAPTKVVSSRKGILTTLKMFNAKNQELQQIVNIEVPKNSKEIEEARALGDLKENAEYHAAKERQTFLNAAVTTLTTEIGSATVIDRKEVDAGKVAFGTRVTLEDHEAEKLEHYTILGPWESKPAENIISYLSPLGDKLMGAKAGERLKFTINERKYDFTVKSIEVADF